MCANGGLRRDRVSGLQRPQHRFVLLHGCRPGLRALSVAAHGRRDRIVAAVE
jgi:hypothetical protein